MKALTVSEMEKLLSGIKDDRLHLQVLLAGRHGLRASEVCGLKWEDVDLANGTITCRRLKGSLTNTQALGQNELERLKSWRDGQKIPSKYVFLGARKRSDGLCMPTSRITFWRQFKAACRTAGIRTTLSPHALKHACAVRMVEANISLPIVQAALGHRSISSTAIYAKPSEDVVNNAMKGVFDANAK